MKTHEHHDSQETDPGAPFPMFINGYKAWSLRNLSLVFYSNSIYILFFSKSSSWGDLGSRGGLEFWGWCTKHLEPYLVFVSLLSPPHNFWIFFILQNFHFFCIFIYLDKFVANTWKTFSLNWLTFFVPRVCYLYFVLQRSSLFSFQK